MKYPTTLLTCSYISVLTEELKSKPETKQTLFSNYSFKCNYIKNNKNIFNKNIDKRCIDVKTHKACKQV